jgi:biopolymer transport protein ExbB
VARQRQDLSLSLSLLYYGNRKRALRKRCRGTYDAHHALVYHFGGAAGAPQDATAYKANRSRSKPP